jgi:hypothetical protein
VISTSRRAFGACDRRERRVPERPKSSAASLRWPVPRLSIMAVTQQLARLTVAELEECGRSVERLDELCSFDLRDERDYLISTSPRFRWHARPR